MYYLYRIHDVASRVWLKGGGFHFTKVTNPAMSLFYYREKEEEINARS